MPGFLSMSFWLSQYKQWKQLFTYFPNEIQIRKAWKFLQLLPGNSETTARPDLDLYYLCSQLSYIHIFHVFSKRHMLWVNVSALAHPLFTPWKERSCKGPGLSYEFFSLRAEPGREYRRGNSAQWPSAKSWQLPSSKCWKERDIQPLVRVEERQWDLSQAWYFVILIGAQALDYMAFQLSTRQTMCRCCLQLEPLWERHGQTGASSAGASEALGTKHSSCVRRWRNRAGLAWGWIQHPWAGGWEGAARASQCFTMRGQGTRGLRWNERSRLGVRKSFLMLSTMGPLGHLPHLSGHSPEHPGLSI